MAGERHRWVKLRLHVYICKKCGCGRVNTLEGQHWVTTCYTPDGKAHRGGHTPACVIGPKTEAYLGKYAAEIAVPF